jgi:hypothetical protein
MRKYFICAAIYAAFGVAVAFVAPQPAAAFMANADGIAKAATATSTTIEVKRSPHKSQPPGWSHGRKVGWHGHSKPPGQR